MKKVAVYTWCYDIGRTNYGQTLQCYATQEILKKIGCSPIILRYRKPLPDEKIIEFEKPEEREKYERAFRIRYVEEIEDKRIDKFFDFIKENISGSIPCYTEDEVKRVSSDAEILICGSDQLWSPEMYDPVALFKFAKKQQKRISYATSGICNTEKNARMICKEICTELKNFYAISVREKSAKTILDEFIDAKVEVVLDPTLLLTESDWVDLAATRISDERYIFAFFLGPFTYNKIVLKDLMKKYGVSKVLYVKSSYFRDEGIVSEGKFIEAEGIGPREFLSLVKNAEAVYTDSYHGTVFSVVFRKQFYVVRHRSPYRISELCENLRIGKRFAESINQLEGLQDIDYTVVLEQLELQRKKSISFLEHSIG